MKIMVVTVASVAGCTGQERTILYLHFSGLTYTVCPGWFCYEIPVLASKMNLCMDAQECRRELWRVSLFLYTSHRDSPRAIPSCRPVLHHKEKPHSYLYPIHTNYTTTLLLKDLCLAKAKSSLKLSLQGGTYIITSMMGPTALG